MQRHNNIKSLYEALVSAYEEASLTPPPPPRERGRWDHRVLDRLDWVNGLFGSLQIRSDSNDARIDENTTFSGLSTYSTVYVGGRPGKISFIFDISPIQGIKVLHARAGEVTDITSQLAPSFEIELEWRKSGDDFVPHLRKQDNDNLDLVFLRPDGMFAQLQVSLSTRNGRFWLSAQEIFNGQIVRTNGEQAAKLPLRNHQVGSHYGLVVPIYPENAYPGSDYLRTFSRMGPKVIDYAVAEGAVSPLSKCVVVKWEPVFPPLPNGTERSGYHSAVVEWFNLVTGTGMAKCRNGKSCFIHFSTIMDDRGRPAWKREFPILQPGGGIALKYDNSDKKRGPAATEVRVL